MNLIPVMDGGDTASAPVFVRLCMLLLETVIGPEEFERNIFIPTTDGLEVGELAVAFNPVIVLFVTDNPLAALEMYTIPASEKPFDPGISLAHDILFITFPVT